MATHTTNLPPSSRFCAPVWAVALVLTSITAAAPAIGAEPPRAEPKQAVVADVIEASGSTVGLTVVARRSKLLRAPAEVSRVAVVDAGIAEVVQVSPRELMILGKAVGKTDVTIWINGATRQPTVVLVRVVSD